MLLDLSRSSVHAFAHQIEHATEGAALFLPWPSPGDDPTESQSAA